MLEKAQGIQSTGKTQYNVQRTARMAAFGFCFAGPVIGAWYHGLHRLSALCVPGTGPPPWWMDQLRRLYHVNLSGGQSSGGLGMLVKTAFDVIVFQLPFLHAYLLVVGLLEGRPVAEAWDRCARDAELSRGWAAAFWAPAQLLNFSVVPARYTAFVVNVFNSVWTTLLSVLQHQRDYGSAGRRLPAPAPST